MNILIAASRGGGIAKKIHDYEVQDEVHPGEKLEYLTRRAVARIPPPHLHKETTHVYILAGLTGITTKHKAHTSQGRYREVTYDEDPSVTIPRVCNEIDKCAKAISDAGATPCFCTITYCYLNKYNQHLLKEQQTHALHHQERYDDMQHNLTTAIDEINNHIDNTNHSFNMSTPFCHTAIRKKKGHETKTILQI